MSRDLDERRTGGAGARTDPLTDEEYRREIDKLQQLAAADARGDD